MPHGEFDKSLSVCFDRPIHPFSRLTRDPTAGKVQRGVIADGVHVSGDAVAYVILGGGHGAGLELVNLD